MLQKYNHLQKCTFLTIALWNTLHISHWTQSRRFFVSSIQGFWKMLQVTASSSFSSLLSPFDDSAKLLDWSGGPGCCFSRGISSLTAVLYGIFFPLPHISNFLALFWFKKMWASCSSRHCRFLAVRNFLKISSGFNG